METFLNGLLQSFLCVHACIVVVTVFFFLLTTPTCGVCYPLCDSVCVLPVILLFLYTLFVILLIINDGFSQLHVKFRTVCTELCKVLCTLEVRNLLGWVAIVSLFLTFIYLYQEFMIILFILWALAYMCRVILILFACHKIKGSTCLINSIMKYIPVHKCQEHI